MTTYTINPFTNKKIEVGGHAHQNVKHILAGSGSDQEKKVKYAALLSDKPNAKYNAVNDNAFCGEAGGYPVGSRKFPVDTEKRCRAALSYAHNAPNEAGIRACALQKAKENGWKCGLSKPKTKVSTKPPSAYVIFKKQQLAALKKQGITGMTAVKQVNAAWKAKK